MATSLKTIPKGWGKINLGTACNFERGIEPGADAYNSDGIGERFLRVVDMTESRNDPVYVDIRTTKKLKEDDVALTLDGTIGAVRTGLKGIYSTGIRKVSFKNGAKSSSRLLYYILQSNDIQRTIDIYASGSTIKHASSAIPYLFTVVPTSPSEREKITEVLATIDSAIEKTDALIEKYKRMKTGMMQDLFRYGIDEKGKIRSEKTHRFKNSLLGKIPEEWEVSRLNNLSDRIGDGIHGTPNYVQSSDYYFVNGNNLKNGRIEITKGTMFVSKTEYEKLKKNLNKQTILISINGTIGNLAFFDGEQVILGKSAAYINLMPEVNKKYIYYFLQTTNTVNYFSKELTGTTIGNLSLATIRNTPIPIPKSKTEQYHIASMIESADGLIREEEKNMEKFLATKRGLMEDLLTGGVRVNHLVNK